MFRRIGVIGWFFFASVITAAGADEAPPTGFSAQGNVVAQALFGGMTINLGADIALLSRGQQFRVDVSHLSVPGSDATINALLSQFLPQGAFTVVLDRATRTTTIWSAEKKKYYVMSPTNAPTSAPQPPNPAAVGSILQSLKSIKDYAIYEMSARLNGKGNVNGHPVTTLQYSIRTQKRGGALSTLSGEVALADDQQGLPVRVTSTVRGKNIGGSFRLDFRTLTAAAPDASSFAVPDGFTKASDPSQIFGGAAANSVLPH